MRFLLWIIVFLSGNCFAANAPLQVTDGVNSCYPYKMIVGTNSCTSGVATITASGGSGTNYWTLTNVGIGTTNNVGVGTISPTDVLYVKSGLGTVTDNYVPVGQGGNDANTTLLAHGNGNFTDSSSNAYTNTNNGATTGNSIYPFAGAGGSMQFVFASSQWTQWNAPPISGTTPFDLEFFFYMSSLPTAGNDYIFSSSETAGGTNGFFIDLLNTAGTYSINFRGVSGSSNVVSFGSNVTVAINTWYGVAFDNDGTNVRIFYGAAPGTASLMATTADASIGASGGNMNFGAFVRNLVPIAGLYFDGYLSEIRYSNISRHTASYTLQTKPFDALSNVAVPAYNLQSNSVASGFIKVNGNDVNNLELGTGSTQMSITTGGNVGIASITPGQVLDVVGNSRVQGTGKAILGSDNSVYTQASATTSGNFGIFTNSLQRAQVDNTGDVEIGTTTTVDGGSGNLSVWNNVGIGTTKVGLAGEAALSVMNGNVGIGTWLPQGALIINGGNVGIGTWIPRDAISVSNSNAAAGGIKLPSTATVTFNFPASTSDYSNYALYGDTTSTVLNAPTSGNLAFRVNNSNLMNIITNGNVGIGSITPGQKLDVQGTVRVIGPGARIVTQQVTAPTVGSNACGSTVQGTVVSGSSDLSGTITAGTLAVTSCAVTFNGTFTSAPNCICQDDSNVLAVRCTASTGTLTVTSLSSMSGDNVTWWCPANS